MSVLKKLGIVKRILLNQPGVVVALSGGVDSSLLLKIAKDTLKKKVIAVTATSPLHPHQELHSAERIARQLQSRHLIIKTKELDKKGFTKNLKNRCYICKKSLFTQIKEIAKKYGYTTVEASNISDLSDFRPGLKALKELNIISPFITAAFTKKEIRSLAKKYHLPNWSKPAAACLASRIPYGKKIDRASLGRIEKSENYLQRLGVIRVRVRDHYPLARIEVLPKDFRKIVKFQKNITRYFKRLGYIFITLDLDGYTTGSLNKLS